MDWLGQFHNSSYPYNCSLEEKSGDGNNSRPLLLRLLNGATEAFLAEDESARADNPTCLDQLAMHVLIHG